MGKNQFYEQLNASGQPDRQFSQWYDYRRHLTDFILADMGDINSILIIGAGNCNDIDLQRLVEDNREVILTDVDLEAMNQGCLRQGVAVSYTSMDYLGLEGSSLLQELQQQMPMFNQEAFKNTLSRILQRTIEHDWQIQPVAKRLVVVLPIYTQLLFRQIESILKVAWMTDLITEEEFSNALRELLDRMPQVINAFNTHLISTCHKEIGMIVFSDYIEDKVEGEYSMQFNPDSFSETYNTYYHLYGMGLGHYGIYALSQKLTVMKERWYLWPFDENRNMFVKGVKVM